MADNPELIGRWVLSGGEIVADEICEEIQRRISRYLQLVSSREGGWRILYQHRTDESYWDVWRQLFRTAGSFNCRPSWELTYPESHLHGGGPPKLTRLSLEEVRQPYPGAPGSCAG
ncbi:Imm27 family immunity protein [Paludibaculum fermentans]|uniref:Uncharacterized protein n=1 Tax=Paludibaculum fermentans TaxID=1473598 RepID=A0A7S7SP35_PALFE|nr:hypothetical protein IRI77_14720 [Paludibaculum fermentans]